MSTIFAPITGQGGAVTVIRLSGERAFEITQRLTGQLPAPRHAALSTLRWEAQKLDRGLVTAFAAPNSFTGEDCVELAVHGGRAVFAAVSAALTAAGARPAEPGEFSRRAHANGRMDLLEAEAMADLIAAETEAQRRLAVDGGGALQDAAAAWREALRQAMAQQEALIDFPDEDLPPEVEAALLTRIAQMRDEIQATLAAAPAAERLRTGLEFVILGPPNAGKSTLLNALAGEDVAIVSEIPGTTRDAVGIRLDFGGVAVHLTDTAGLRETADTIEAEGVRRAEARAARADLILAVAAAPAPEFPPTPAGIETLHLITKADLLDAAPPGFLAVSARSGQGIAALRRRLVDAAARLTAQSAPAALARPRQTACLRDTEAALTRALETPEPELRGEELREAAHALARLTGAIGVEEILDAVFSGFCIGK
ncbi:MAG: tRNA uridine-5-carboxymethylaminomethyl(34) synthesis GTPase MnmE [Rhodospirillales bacterium 20-64-7]|nr:MAG: tRNA uridine-5-carboxymethylaminomethyl(34) synthesis GTPase MnmE [Rhodospirillales bacterium 20-64-7]